MLNNHQNNQVTFWILLDLIDAMFLEVKNHSNLMDLTQSLNYLRHCFESCCYVWSIKILVPVTPMDTIGQRAIRILITSLQKVSNSKSGKWYNECHRIIRWLWRWLAISLRFLWIVWASSVRCWAAQMSSHCPVRAERRKRVEYRPVPHLVPWHSATITSQHHSY